MAIEIKPYDPAKKAEVLELVRLCLGEKPDIDRDARWWDWRHEANPFGRSLILTAEVDGRIVGVRPLLRWQLKCGGRLIEAVKPVDTVTHPDFRRRGIFTKLTGTALEQARHEGIDLLFNTPNKNSMPGYLRMGWKHVARLPVCVRLLRPWGILNRLPFSGLSRKRSETGNAPRNHCETSSTLTAVSLLDEADRLAWLSGGCSQNGELTTPRTSAFLRWRYAQHPHATYYAQAERVGGRLAGALFYRIKRRMNLREVLLDDIIVGPDRPDLAGTLLRRLCRNVQADYIVAHCSERSSLWSVLRKQGFRRLPGKHINLVARNLGGETSVNDIHQHGWSLTMADIEGL